MKKHFIFLIVIFSVINLSFSFLTKITKKNNIRQDVVPNMVVVKFKTEAKGHLLKGSAAQKSFDKLLSVFGTSKVEKVFLNHIAGNTMGTDLSNIYYVYYSKDINPYEVAKSLEKNSLIEYAEPKRIRRLCHLPNDAQYLTQWALYQIKMEQAWEVSKGSTNVVIGIVDTGVDWTHPDLANNIWTNYDEIPGNGIDDDHNGYIDDIRGWDFGGAGNNGSPTPDNNPNEDRADHGTHVAGIASASTNNSIGVAGIGYNCKIMPIKVTENDRRPDGPPDVLFGPEGIVYGADNGAQIINCSWGGGGFSRYENDAIQYATQKGSLVVAAAGNDDLYQTVFTPASYDNVLAVAATGSSDTKAYFSNYGPYVGVCSPGINIISTWYNNSYSYEGGTSMACPHVAGLAALVKSKFPDFIPMQVSEKIRVTCDKIDTLNPNYVGFLGGGRINAYKALTMSSPAVRIAKYYFDDSTKGNGNGILEPGEKVLVKMEFINYLDNTTNLQVKFLSNNINVKVISGDLSLGKVSTLQKVNNFQSPFEIEIGANIVYDLEVVFSLKFQDIYYDDQQKFAISMNPSYMQIVTPNIDMTIGSQGNLGYIDSPDNVKGNGFTFKNFENSLFEGALMFGNASSNISNCARNADHTGKDEHFKILRAIGFSKTNNADNEGICVFNDDLNSNKYGITTTLRTYSYNNESYGNFVILSYTLKNNNQNSINNFYSGIFFDWDISIDNGGVDDISKFDNSDKIGYVYDSRGINKTFAGVSLLNNIEKMNFFHMLNGDPINWQIYDGFTNNEKYLALSHGITKKEMVGAGDVSMTIGAGPFNIPAGESINIVFVILAGESLSDLQAARSKALEKFSNIRVSIDNPVSQPKAFELYGNYPNPFNPTTTIGYNIEKQCDVKIKIYDIRGSVVKEIFKQNLNPGEYFESINLSNLSSGIYFYRLQAFDIKKILLFEQSRKMTLLK